MPVDSPKPGVRARRRAARRAGKLSAEEFARQLGVAPRLVRWRTDRGEIAADADGMIEHCELDRVRATFPCKAECGRVALGETGYCHDHKAMSQRGVERTPEQRERIGAGMRGQPRPAMSAITRARWQDPEQREALLQAQRQGTERARAAAEHEKAERGGHDVADVVAELRARGILRSYGSVTAHIRQGLLDAERISLPGRGYFVCSAAAVDEYAELLRGYPDGRLRRFDAYPRWRGYWYMRAHRSTAEWGRLSVAIAPGRVGRPRELSSEQEAEIRRRAGNGQSTRAIAAQTGISRMKIRRLLDGDKVGRNPL